MLNKKSILDNIRNTKINLQSSKRKSDIAITPLRKETGHVRHNYYVPIRIVQMLTNTCKPPTSPSNFQFCGLPEQVKIKYCEKKKITGLYGRSGFYFPNCLILRLAKRLSEQSPTSKRFQLYYISSHRSWKNPYRRGCNVFLFLKIETVKILMLREAVLNKRSSILVLPYVAVVQEKVCIALTHI